MTDDRTHQEEEETTPVTPPPKQRRCRSPHVNAPAAGQGPVGQRQQPLATPATERQASLRAVPETLAVRDERSTPAARPERDAVSVKATPGLERISLWSVCCAAGEDVELELQREGLDEEAQGRLRAELSEMMASFGSESPGSHGDFALQAILLEGPAGPKACGFLVAGDAPSKSVPCNASELPATTRKRAQAAPERVPALRQLWLAPAHRRPAVIMAALLEAFGSSEHLVVEAPPAAVAQLLGGAGWALCGSRWASGMSFFCRYVKDLSC
mmetsp:Transcript_20434/g.57828  ORF Transcript_20434/g.57828 Transcript_20434/m.57828 type:complete len:271 (+) Transcript_20434:90-902(+)